MATGGKQPTQRGHSTRTAHSAPAETAVPLQDTAEERCHATNDDTKMQKEIYELQKKCTQLKKKTRAE